MIPLRDSGYAYVNACDYEWLNCYTWWLENGYPARGEKQRVILMHLQIVPPPNGKVVDRRTGLCGNGTWASVGHRSRSRLPCRGLSYSWIPMGSDSVLIV